VSGRLVTYVRVSQNDASYQISDREERNNSKSSIIKLAGLNKSVFSGSYQWHNYRVQIKKINKQVCKKFKLVQILGVLQFCNAHMAGGRAAQKQQEVYLY